MSLDEACLDVTGFESIHGSIHQMAVAIKQRIKDELGLCASVGIASGKVVAKRQHDVLPPNYATRLTIIGLRAHQSEKNGSHHYAH